MINDINFFVINIKRNFIFFVILQLLSTVDVSVAMSSDLEISDISELTSSDFLNGKKFIFDEVPGWQDDTGGWINPVGLSSTISKIKRASFNVYVPCIWHGNGALFPSDNISVRDKDFVEEIKLTSSDSFYRLINKSKSEHIEVYPWFAVALRNSSLSHLDNFYDVNSPYRAFDLHRKEYRDFIINLMMEVVSSYDIDGIVLDLIRTMGICTCDRCKLEYKTQYNSSIEDDIDTWRFNNAARARLSQWNLNAVSDIVRRFSERARALKPNIKIAACGHPNYELDTLFLQGRDTILWLNNGWIDFIFAMDYYQELDHVGYSEALNKMNLKNRLVILSGNYEKITVGDKVETVPRKPEIVYQHLKESLEQYRSGSFGLYWYGSLSEDQIRAINKIEEH